MLPFHFAKKKYLLYNYQRGDLVKKKEPINMSSLLISIVTLVIGILLCFNDSEGIFNLIGYIVSGLLLLIGTIRLIIYIVSSKKTHNTEISGIFSSIMLLVLGGFIYLYPSSIMVTVSLIIGALLMFNGIQRLILGVAVRKFDRTGFIFYLAESIIILLLGFVIITQKFINLMGIFLIVYSVAELSSYIFYTSQNKDYSEVLNKKVTKEMKEKEAQDAIIEE